MEICLILYVPLYILYPQIGFKFPKKASLFSTSLCLLQWLVKGLKHGFAQADAQYMPCWLEDEMHQKQMPI